MGKHKLMHFLKIRVCNIELIIREFEVDVYLNYFLQTSPVLTSISLLIRDILCGHIYWLSWPTAVSRIIIRPWNYLSKGNFIRPRLGFKKLCNKANTITQYPIIQNYCTITVHVPWKRTLVNRACNCYEIVRQV